MRTLIFCTNNPNKLREAREILKDFRVIGKPVRIREIQGTSRQIVKEKAKEAFTTLEKPLFVEDTALHIDGLKGLPGPYIKSFINKLGAEGIFRMVSGFQNIKATAVTTLGYADGKAVKIFEGKVHGRIVKPRGTSRFGFDPVFRPDGFSQTYAELGKKKNDISHRRKALEKFRDYLRKQNE